MAVLVVQYCQKKWATTASWQRGVCAYRPPVNNVTCGWKVLYLPVSHYTNSACLNLYDYEYYVEEVFVMITY